MVVTCRVTNGENWATSEKIRLLAKMRQLWPILGRYKLGKTHTFPLFKKNMFYFFQRQHLKIGKLGNVRTTNILTSYARRENDPHLVELADHLLHPLAFVQRRMT